MLPAASASEESTDGPRSLEYMADWPFEDTVEIGYVLGSECAEDPATARDFELRDRAPGRTSGRRAARAIGLTATGTWVDTPTVTGSLPGHVAAGPLHRRLILPVLDDLGWRRARADPDDVDAPGPAGLVSGEQVRDPLRVQSVARSLVREP